MEADFYQDRIKNSKINQISGVDFNIPYQISGFV